MKRAALAAFGATALLVVLGAVAPPALAHTELLTSDPADGSSLAEAPRTVELTFSEDLAAGIVHLLSAGAPSGTYNLTNEGPAQSWFGIARDVFVRCGREAADVIPTSTAAYGEGRDLAPRPRHSVLPLDKIRATGFIPADARDRLRTYPLSANG